MCTKSSLVDLCSSASAVTITIAPRDEGGGYPGEPSTRAYQLEIESADLWSAKPPTAVTVNGRAVPKLPSSAAAAGYGRTLGYYIGNATGLFEGSVLVVGTGEQSTAAMVVANVQR
eukprot:SAG11_NODE_5930_length_1431_cov_1.328829_3_plen_116_part_00